MTVMLLLEECRVLIFIKMECRRESDFNNWKRRQSGGEEKAEGISVPDNSKHASIKLRLADNKLTDYLSKYDKIRKKDYKQYKRMIEGK